MRLTTADYNTHLPTCDGRRYFRRTERANAT
jgi:hypothetical protein